MRAFLIGGGSAALRLRAGAGNSGGKGRFSQSLDLEAMSNRDDGR